jgi:hypothetical protein
MFGKSNRDAEALSGFTRFKSTKEEWKILPGLLHSASSTELVGGAVIV